MTPAKKVPPTKAKKAPPRRRPSPVAVDPLEPLHVGSDEIDGQPVTLSRTPSGRVVLLPVSLQNLDTGTLELVANMQGCATEIGTLRRDLDGMVRDARRAGLSWSGIGFATGLSSQGARNRWMTER